MKKIVDSYFDFSRTERRGFLTLSFLLVLFVLAPAIFKLFKAQPNTDFKSFEKAIALFEAQDKNSPIVSQKFKKETQASVIPSQLFSFNPNTLSADSLALLGLKQKVVKNIINYRNKGGRFYKKENLQKIYSLDESTYLKLADYINIPATPKTRPMQTSFKASKSEYVEAPPSVSLVNFDPNTANKDLLRQLGLSEKVNNIIHNFRNKGGRFYKKEDLQKIYGLTPTQYQKLEPYISIAETTNQKKQFEKASKTENKFPQKKQALSAPIDINTATPEEWQSLKGIGPYYSKKIVAYREKLGGFVKVNQVKEIYGFPDSVYQKIKPLLKASDFIKKINLNSANKEELSAHPYIPFKKAKTIVSYRNQHGAFKTVEDLEKVGVLDNELIAKIAPYLEL